MKKVRIDSSKNERFPMRKIYANPSVKFCWLGKAKNNVFLQTSMWHGCRETFTGEIRRIFSISPNSYTNLMDITHTRICVLRRHKDKGIDLAKKMARYDLAWMKNAKRILNLFEKYLGWGLTKIYEVDEKDYPNQDLTSAYVFTASPKWTRAPQLLSLYLLILRLSRDPRFHKVTSLDDLGKWVRQHRSSFKNKPEKSSTDFKYFAKVQPKLFMILDNVDYLFFGRSRKDAYEKQPGYFGINSMVESLGSDNYTSTRYKELIKKHSLGENLKKKGN